MDKPILTGSQKSHLRGLGQQLEASLKLGKAGLTPAFLEELQRLLHARELVKLRFLGFDRDERAAFCERIAGEGRCECVGAVGTPRSFIARTRTLRCGGSPCRNESGVLTGIRIPVRWSGGRELEWAQMILGRLVLTEESILPNHSHGTLEFSPSTPVLGQALPIAGTDHRSTGSLHSTRRQPSRCAASRSGAFCLNAQSLRCAHPPR